MTLELLGPDDPPVVLVGCQARSLGVAGVAVAENRSGEVSSRLVFSCRLVLEVTLCVY